MVKQLSIPMHLADRLAVGVRVALDEAYEHLMDNYTVNLSPCAIVALEEAAEGYETLLDIIMEQRGYDERPEGNQSPVECDAT